MYVILYMYTVAPSKVHIFMVCAFRYFLLLRRGCLCLPLFLATSFSRSRAVSLSQYSLSLSLLRQSRSLPLGRYREEPPPEKTKKTKKTKRSSRKTKKHYFRIGKAAFVYFLAFLKKQIPLKNHRKNCFSVFLDKKKMKRQNLFFSRFCKLFLFFGITFLCFLSFSAASWGQGVGGEAEEAEA